MEGPSGEEQEGEGLMRVYLYWNLHKHLFSVRNTKTGLVVDHARRVKMTNVTFAVGQKGRERVLAEGRKNVHAGVRGEQVEVHHPCHLPS